MRRVLCEYEDILAVSLPSSVTSFDKDVILINVYDSPPNSSYRSKQLAAGEDVNVMEQLMNFTAKLDNKSIILADDLNARTAYLNTEVMLHISYNFGPHTHKSRRSCRSKDRTTNERGRRNLEMLENCTLKILNWATVD